MYLKTTNPHFYQFGYTQSNLENFQHELKYYNNQNPGFLKKIPSKVSYEVIDGIALLVIFDHKHVIHKFVIHRVTILNPYVEHVIIPITKSTIINKAILTKKKVDIEYLKLSHQLEFKPIQSIFYVSDIYSYYYGVKGKNYHYDGESHNHWELIYVDSGELIVHLDDHSFNLKKQDMMVYFPQQFHKHEIIGGKSSSYLSIMFDLDLSVPFYHIEALKNKVFECNNEMHFVIQNFIKEATYMETDNIPFSRSMMVTYLQYLLFSLLKSTVKPHKNETNILNPVQFNFENETINEITSYIIRNIENNISVQELCTEFGMSRSSLQSLFKKYVGLSPIAYINKIQMETSQRLILENRYSLTQISNFLGFSSIHYFSRKFKEYFGIPPSEYEKSIFKTDKKQS